MRDVATYGVVITLVTGALFVGVLSNRVTAAIRVPAPAIFLIVAGVASDLFPVLGSISVTTTQRIVTVALVAVLFDGGMHLGWARFRSAAMPITLVGVVGTFLTAGAIAALARVLFGFGWQSALLLGTALAPTDPAVVFSVLGKREVAGRSGVILEGESGANDPVGIALMAALLAAESAGGSVSSAIGTGIAQFCLQMGVGAVVGVALGFGLRWVAANVSLPSEGLYSLRTLAGAGVIYGVATVTHGSGFLAVFIAGIVLGDAKVPYQNEIRRFHASLASLAEIVAFTVLGLTVTVHRLPDHNVLFIGLALAALLAFVVRPLLVGPLLLGFRLRRGEKAFILWSGLKGAVPILLGTFIVGAQAEGASRSYDIIFVVVLFSVVVQGGLVPYVARRCHIPMRTVEPLPWSTGMRFRREPKGIRRFVVAESSPADGRAIGELDLGDGVWISVVSRRGELLPIRPDTVLAAGDEVLALTDPGANPGTDLATRFLGE
jgi:cell volume regulation protein A